LDGIGFVKSRAAGSIGFPPFENREERGTPHLLLIQEPHHPERMVHQPRTRWEPNQWQL